MTHPITQAREGVRSAKTNLEEREQDLTRALVDEIQEHLRQYRAGMQLTAMLVRELPDTLSLDRSALKQEIAKSLEETQRTLRGFLEKLDRLKEDG